VDLFDAFLRTFLYLLAFVVFLTAVGVAVMIFYFILEWLWKREW